MNPQGENSAGKQVAISAKLRNDTGIDTTVALAATPQALFGPTFVVDQNFSGGLLAFDVATGRVSLVGVQGAGRYLVEASLSDVVGPNTATVGAFVTKNGAQVSNSLRKVEPAAAVRSGLGVAKAVIELLAVGDFVDIRLSVGTNGQVVGVKDAYLTVVKIG